MIDNFELVDWEDVKRDNHYPEQDDNRGYNYGINWLEDEAVVETEWFKTEKDRSVEVDKFVEEKSGYWGGICTDEEGEEGVFTPKLSPWDLGKVEWIICPWCQGDGWLLDWDDKVKEEISIKCDACGGTGKGFIEFPLDKSAKHSVMQLH